MRSLIAQKRRAFLAAQIGRTLSVLTLDEAHQDTRVALSTNYLKVALPFSDLAPNTLLDVRAGRVAEGILYAYRESQDG